jgi:protein SCO1/2
LNRTRPARLAAGRPTARLREALVVAALLVLAGRAAPASGIDADVAALRASQAAIGRQTSDHEFLDQHGRPFRLSDLRGRPLALNMVYTSCYDVCTALTLYLRDAVKVGREALGTEGFSVLTVGFDAARDDPERMRIFGRDRGIDDPNWRLASADAATIRRLADEVGFTWVASPRGFDHVAQVSILDSEGRVVRQVYGEEIAPPALVEPIRTLLLGRSLERLSARELVGRVRLYCSVYDPVEGRYRFDYSMFAGAIPLLMAFGMAAAAIVVAGRRKR